MQLLINSVVLNPNRASTRVEGIGSESIYTFHDDDAAEVENALVVGLLRQGYLELRAGRLQKGGSWVSSRRSHRGLIVTALDYAQLPRATLVDGEFVLGRLSLHLGNTRHIVAGAVERVFASEYISRCFVVEEECERLLLEVEGNLRERGWRVLGPFRYLHERDGRDVSYEIEFGGNSGKVRVRPSSLANALVEFGLPLEFNFSGSAGSGAMGAFVELQGDVSEQAGVRARV